MLAFDIIHTQNHLATGVSFLAQAPSCSHLWLGRTNAGSTDIEIVVCEDHHKWVLGSIYLLRWTYPRFTRERIFGYLKLSGEGISICIYACDSINKQVARHGHPRVTPIHSPSACTEIESPRPLNSKIPETQAEAGRFYSSPSINHKKV